MTQQLGLQEKQKEPEHNLKNLSAQDLNKSYQSLQQQIQQATSPQQKAQFKNQLNDVHQEIKQPDSEPDQSLKH
ncbi:hypothetical protein EFE02_05825 [Pediococcus pentosaceus]|nr:hypothetical protein [Pediococcus pentosaceus]